MKITGKFFALFLGRGKVIGFLLIFFLTSCISDSKKTTQKLEEKPLESITLIFAGDAMHHMPQLYASYVAKTNSLDYTPVFQYIKPFVQSADLAFCNLETLDGLIPAIRSFLHPTNFFLRLKIVALM